MRRAVLLSLAVATGLTGCTAGPSRGVVAEYRPGTDAATVPVRWEANYALRPLDAPDSEPLSVRHLLPGEPVGFRRESDGSLAAYAAGKAIVLPEGQYAWAITAETELGRWGRFEHDSRRLFRAGCRTGAGVAGVTAVVVGWLCVCGAFWALYYWVAEEDRKRGIPFRIW